MPRAKKIHVGNIGVDTGTVIVGDPGYIMWHAEDPNRADALGKNWDEFCSKLDGNATPIEMRENLDYAVVVGSGYGDGIYPVYIEVDDNNRVARLIVDFRRS